MVVLGTDSHKHSHTVVAVDANGAELAHKTVKATPAGHLEALRWAEQWAERSWALEDCRHLSRRLEADLLRAGERVVRVPPKLMAGARRGGRELGKSDPIDALAVARAALREPGLAAAVLEGAERELRLLVDHRDDLVAERTRAQNRLLWHLHDLDPGWRLKPGALSTFKWLDAVAARLEGLDGVVAEIARELVAHVRDLTVRAHALERRIQQQVTPMAPELLAMHGCGPLTAAKAIGETGGAVRFRSPAAFARHNGTAPIPVWSGNPARHRLNRGGNRQLNAALHRIAVTQIRLDGPGRVYYRRRRARGDTTMEALRALKRRLARVVFTLLQPTHTAAGTCPPAAA